MSTLTIPFAETDAPEEDSSRTALVDSADPVGPVDSDLMAHVVLHACSKYVAFVDSVDHIALLASADYVALEDSAKFNALVASVDHAVLLEFVEYVTLERLFDRAVPLASAEYVALEDLLDHAALEDYVDPAVRPESVAAVLSLVDSNLARDSAPGVSEETGNAALGSVARESSSRLLLSFHTLLLSLRLW